jgi:hypothetical protein
MTTKPVVPLVCGVLLWLVLVVAWLLEARPFSSGEAYIAHRSSDGLEYLRPGCYNDPAIRNIGPSSYCRSQESSDSVSLNPTWRGAVLTYPQSHSSNLELLSGSSAYLGGLHTEHGAWT